MPRMSFSKTIPQMRAKTKTVTRRDGWWDEKTDTPRVPPGGRITTIEKGMGLRAGERQVVLGEIEVVSVRRERLADITPEDVVREGFPGWSVAEFLELYGKRPPEHVVTRIEFRHIEEPQL